MKLTWFGLWVLCGPALAAPRTVAEYDWQKLAKDGQLRGGEIVEADGKFALKIANTNSTPLRVEFLQIEKPAVQTLVYGIEGQVKYASVQGDGFLEMWNQFPPDKPGLPPGRFFSRTLGSYGPLAKITGSSGWRRFVLPFDRTGTSNAPTRLELALHLPGPGTVYLSPLALVEHPNLNSALGQPGSWWTERTAGLVGGVGGGLLGCLGGLMGWLVSRGRARYFVLSTGLVLIFIGGLCLVFGIAALVLKQPFYVVYPLLLGGVLILGILPFQLKRFQQQYQAMEFRRMNSLDALRG